MRRSWRVEDPYDLVGTVGGIEVITPFPALRVVDGGVWYATRRPEGAATLRMRRDGAGVVADAWGPGAEAALERLPALAGLDDDAREFAPGEEPLRTLQRRRQGLRLPRTGAVFETLGPAIVAQKVAGKEASRSWWRLVRRWGEPAPAPHGAPPLWLPPPPETLAAIAWERYHLFGIERRRSETLRRAARRARKLEELLALPFETGAARLQSLPGIGPWTAITALQIATGHPDAVPLGDWNLPSVVAWNLAGEPRADDRRMLELLEPYRGHRARVVQLLLAAGSAPPRFGPRYELRRIEDW